VELGFFQNLRVLTGHGYAVLVPSLPNPPGGMTEPTDRLAERLLLSVQAATADPDLGPRIDPSRAALIGYSFGGYTVMAAITQTDRFEAAVEMDGISDLTPIGQGFPVFSEVEPEGGYSTNWHTGNVEATQPKMLVRPGPTCRGTFVTARSIGQIRSKHPCC